MNQKAERKARSHEAILESAASLLRERGIRGSSVADVMRGAGLTVGGFYGHFASKEQLFAATIREAASAKWDRLVATARGETRAERLMSVVGRYISRTHRDHPVEGCLLPTAAPEVAREDGEPYREVLSSEIDGFLRSLVALQTEAPGDGSRETSREAAPSAKDARDKALGLVALMYGAVSLARAVKGTPLSDEVLRAAKKLAARAVEEA